MDKKAIYENIDASLTHGKVFHKTEWIISYVVLSFFLIPLLIINIMFLLSRWDVFPKEIDVVMYFWFMLFFSIIVIILIIYITKKRRLTKKVLLWLEDVVRSRARTTIIGGSAVKIGSFATKLQVKFKYNEKKYVLYSGDPTKNYFIIKNHGYYAGLYRYGNCEVEILYSPKYNEVLFIKGSR